MIHRILFTTKTNSAVRWGDRTRAFELSVTPHTKPFSGEEGFSVSHRLSQIIIPLMQLLQQVIFPICLPSADL